MPRPAASVLRTTEQLLDEIERSGSATPSDVLQLCKLYRAAERTIRAQREVILEHVRTIRRIQGKTE
jgi:hypothetical protein